MQPFSETHDYSLPLSCRSPLGDVFPRAKSEKHGREGLLRGRFLQLLSEMLWSVGQPSFLYMQSTCV